MALGEGPFARACDERRFALHVEQVLYGQLHGGESGYPPNPLREEAGGGSGGVGTESGGTVGGNGDTGGVRRWRDSEGKSSCRAGSCCAGLSSTIRTTDMLQASWVSSKVACRPARRSTLAAPRLVTRARLSDWFGGENYMASKIGNKVDLETRDQVRDRTGLPRRTDMLVWQWHLHLRG